MYPYPYYQQVQPYPQQVQRPKNEGMKHAAIILFVCGFCLKFLGFLLLFILIGIFPLFLGAICDVIGFVCLCLI